MEEELNNNSIKEGVAESENHTDGEKHGASWYILQVLSGCEYKVQIYLQQLIEEKSLQERVFRILVPEEDFIEIKDGKRVEKTVKIYPGYVFVEAIMDEFISYEFQRVPHVDILKVLYKIGDNTKKIEVDFAASDTIKVTAGPFRGYSGVVKEVYVEKSRVKAMISVFGRETPVELGFDQVERVV
jgi:transcriptional antiterminator NusG